MDNSGWLHGAPTARADPVLGPSPGRRHLILTAAFEVAAGIIPRVPWRRLKLKEAELGSAGQSPTRLLAPGTQVPRPPKPRHRNPCKKLTQTDCVHKKRPLCSGAVPHLGASGQRCSQQ